MVKLALDYDGLYMVCVLLLAPQPKTSLHLPPYAVQYKIHPNTFHLSI